MINWKISICCFAACVLIFHSLTFLLRLFFFQFWNPISGADTAYSVEPHVIHIIFFLRSSLCILKSLFTPIVLWVCVCVHVYSVCGVACHKIVMVNIDHYALNSIEVFMFFIFFFFPIFSLEQQRLHKDFTVELLIVGSTGSINFIAVEIMFLCPDFQCNYVSEKRVRCCYCDAKHYMSHETCEKHSDFLLIFMPMKMDKNKLHDDVFSFFVSFTLSLLFIGAQILIFNFFGTQNVVLPNTSFETMQKKNTCVWKHSVWITNVNHFFNETFNIHFGAVQSNIMHTCLLLTVIFR